ncbi:DNA excision repair protein ERCC-5 [Trichomycterus rosablanca]|uniref:DNA excision repair protein ERCC-5 n=1 Tax=Trichomycterus rosablanca TaxID=2290929 RepID=UPI002F3559EA
MGVQGLWKLLESTGKPINPETLEGKIIAVDISIWLNQAVKGVRDREGNNVRNAHLLMLFNRLCKLLFFRIRPVFVYDGDAPLLKKQTLAIRRQRKEEMVRESKQTHEKLLKTFLKRQAINAALGKHSQESAPSISSVRRDEVDDMYVLPALPPVEEKERSSSEEEPDTAGEQTPDTYFSFQDDFYENPNSIDINSEEFSLLSPEIKHEILKDMKEFSKRRRTMHNKPPERSGDFSQYQLQGLLQRSKLNQRLEGVEKEMSQRSCGDLEQRYDQDEERNVESRRLISEESSHYILIKGTQKSDKTPEPQPASDCWSGGPWSRKGRAKGKPKPLWRPLSDDIDEENEPSSSSSSSALKADVEDRPVDAAPASPRTLRAIQAAMLDTSSDEDERGAASHQDEKGGVSRSKEPLRKVQTQRKYVISSSDEENEPAETTRSKAVEASPQTLLDIQMPRGDKVSPPGAKTFQHISSEEEETEEGVKKESKASRAPTPTEEPKLEEVAPPSSSDLESDVETRASVKADVREPACPREPSAASETGSLQEGSLSVSAHRFNSDMIRSEPKEEKIEEISVKSEDEGSSSDDGFIEVSEGEEASELEDSSVVPEELQEESNTEEQEVISEEESQDLSGLSPSETQEQDSKPSRADAAAPAASEWDDINLEELVRLEKDLQAEQSSLHGQQQQQQRSAATVTGQMCQESQELLRLFGVPFLVAPMEAEAQCAALDRTDQTHGTITDDSDVWLFGGRHVYKNFFSNNKYVEHYQYLDIQNQLGIDRTKLINLAYLLGSDYTEGIQGVGYVKGMEILNEFPGLGLEPLTQFRTWWSEAQSKKKLADDPKDTKVKKKLRALKLHPAFPNPAVAEAYLHPTVEQSEGTFSWGHPQVDLIKEFCYSRFGWSSRKTEETLQPVLKQLSTQLTQRRIDSFFRLEQQEQQAIRSQRLRRAVTCLKRKEREGMDEGESDDDDDKVSPVKQGKKEKGKEKESNSTPSAMFEGGFIGSDVCQNILEGKNGEGRWSDAVSTDVEMKLAIQGKSEPSKTKSSSSSSSSEDELEHKNKANLVIARSVFEGITRGRGKRGGRGGGRGRTNKSLKSK